MKKQFTEQQINHLSQQYREYSVDNLDVSISRKLQQARIKALKAKQKNTLVLQWSGGFACATLLLAVLIFQSNFQNSFQNQPQGNEDYLLVEEMLQIEENQEIVNELEFYQWLEQQDDLEKIV